MPTIDEAAHNSNNIERREDDSILMVTPDAGLDIHTFELILIPQNPINFVLQPIVESESQLSTFVDVIHVATDIVASVADAVFLNNSWASMENLGEEPIQNEGVFTSALSKLKKKQSTRTKQQYTTKSQACLKNLTL